MPVRAWRNRTLGPQRETPGEQAGRFKDHHYIADLGRTPQPLMN